MAEKLTPQGLVVGLIPEEKKPEAPKEVEKPTRVRKPKA